MKLEVFKMWGFWVGCRLHLSSFAVQLYGHNCFERHECASLTSHCSCGLPGMATERESGDKSCFPPCFPPPPCYMALCSSFAFVDFVRLSVESTASVPLSCWLAEDNTRSAWGKMCTINLSAFSIWERHTDFKETYTSGDIYEPFGKIIDGICSDPEYRGCQPGDGLVLVCVWQGQHMSWGRVGFCRARLQSLCPFHTDRQRT